jgi:hypothetical protein
MSKHGRKNLQANASAPALSGEPLAADWLDEQAAEAAEPSFGDILEAPAEPVVSPETVELAVPVAAAEPRPLPLDQEMMACGICTPQKPCIEHFVKAGYKAENYEQLFAQLEAECQASAAAALDAPKQKATQRGHTLCRITGTAIHYNGRVYGVGVVDEFDDASVLDMPDVFVSVE